MKNTRSYRSLWLPFFSVLSISLTAQARITSTLCDELLSKATATSSQNAVKNDLNNDQYFVQLFKTKSSEGALRSFYDDELKTPIFYMASGRVDTKSMKPMPVNPDSKGLFIFVHGSGTSKSSGKNFGGQFNQLAELGFSALSFDMPFHMNGPMSDKLYDADVFMAWLKKLVDKYRIEGMPIYMVGHSFGPDVIAEYMRRYPNDIQGAAMLSPAGFNPTLEKWQRQKTNKMIMGGNVQENTLAGQWAAQVSEGFEWTRGETSTDPSLLNPDANIRVLSGDREEYVPAPIGGKNRTPIGRNTYDLKAALEKIMRRATITIEPGIGHYLFDHKDASGLNVVLREMMLVAGVDLRSLSEIKKQIKTKNLTELEKFESLLADDPIFYQWAIENVGARSLQSILVNGKLNAAKGIMISYQDAYNARLAEIEKGMESSREWSPAFYELFQKQKANGIGTMMLLYADHIARLTADQLVKYGLVHSRK